MPPKLIVPPSIMDAAVRDYVDGLSCVASGARHGLNYQFLRKELIRRGITLRSRSDVAYTTSRNFLMPGEQAAAVRMYTVEKVSAKTIAARLGRAQCGVQGALKRAGVELRPMGVVPKYTLREDYFASIDTDEKAYWLGFIAADGCVHSGGNGTDEPTTLSIALQGRDAPHLQKFREAVGTDRPLRFHQQTANKNAKSSHPQVSIAVRSQGFVAGLIRNGIQPRKSLTLGPWNGPAELMPAWFRGLIDGDGGWRLADRPGSGRSVNLYLCATNAVAGAFRDFIKGVTGGDPSAMYHLPTTPEMSHVFYCRIPVVQAATRCLYAGATVWLDRKKAIVDRIFALQPLRGRWYTTRKD